MENNTYHKRGNKRGILEINHCGTRHCSGLFLLGFVPLSYSSHHGKTTHTTKGGIKGGFWKSIIVVHTIVPDCFSLGSSPFPTVPAMENNTYDERQKAGNQPFGDKGGRSGLCWSPESPFDSPFMGGRGVRGVLGDKGGRKAKSWQSAILR
jgi:hypothetical protein